MTMRVASKPNARRRFRDLVFEMLPDQGNWSDEKYLALTDHAERLVEFTDGYLEPLPMPTDKHQSIMEYLFFALTAYLRPIGGKAHTSGIRLRIREGKYRQPDVIALRRADDPRREDRTWLGADLVLEVVSKDKPERDLIDKRFDYAEGAVPEYWIVNPLNQTISVLRLDRKRYKRHGRFRRGQIATSATLAEFAVAVDDVFDAD
jgi:Uma2 family endonuclease